MNCKIYNVGGADSTVATIGLSDESQVIAHVPYETPEDRANAEFIVRAVNSHDALLAACYIALTAVDTALCGTPSPAYFSAVKTALKSASATSVEDNLAVNVKEIKEACEKAHIALHAAIALATGNESGKE